MKRLAVLFVLLLILPCAALAGGGQTLEMERGYFATIAPEPTPEEAPTLPPEVLETVPPEKTAYPCTAVANAPSGGVVPMYEKPDGNSRVIMNYYRGVRITVLRETMPGFVLAQVGEKTASIMGYMRRSDLAFGSAALRDVVPEFVQIEFNREAEVLCYCDSMAPEIGVCKTDKTYYTIGKNDDKWVQLANPTGMTLEGQEGLWQMVRQTPDTAAGFVQLETGMARGYEVKAIRWEVEPIPGEITRDQAIRLAIWTITSVRKGGDESWRIQGEIPDELRREETLLLLPFDAVWMYSPLDSGFVNLSVNVEYECDEYSIAVGMYPDGQIRYGSYEEAAEGS